jgi:hypothetical protein
VDLFAARLVDHDVDAEGDELLRVPLETELLGVRATFHLRSHP